MAFNNGTRQGVASGDVVYTDGTDTVYTEFVEFDVDTLEGVMFDAEFDVPSNRLEMRGAGNRQDGRSDLHVQAWVVHHLPLSRSRGPRALADRGRRGGPRARGLRRNTRNTTIEILGVPILWLPWMIYPLKSERQSGLLFPDFSIGGRNGFEVGLPVFWALGRSGEPDLHAALAAEAGGQGRRRSGVRARRALGRRPLRLLHLRRGRRSG